jgi:hypothetical protein
MKPLLKNLSGEEKMVAPHVKRRRRLAKVEEATPAPKAEAPAPAAKKKEEAPKKKAKKTYKKKED